MRSKSQVSGLRLVRSGPDRRVVALGAIAGIPCLAVGLRAAVAEAAASGKPVLTEHSFNARVSELSHADGGRNVAGQMHRDFRGFVRNNFTLTPIQQRRLDAIPPDAIGKLQGEFGRVASSGGRMNISFDEPTSGHRKGLGKQVRMNVAASGGHSNTVAWQTE
jgi:hypothetical protein